MSDTTDHKRFRFSLKVLLILIALAAIIFGAYRVGYQHGYSKAEEKGRADYVIWK